MSGGRVAIRTFRASDFPRAEYWSGVQALQDALILLYEPRRGGTSMSSGGRMGFVAFAFVDRIYDDPADPTHAYLDYRYFCGTCQRV